MKVKAIAPWFGGKRMLAPEVVKQLGPHKQYFEPFCGSMAVLFAKQQSKQETVNDLHGDIVNLARVVADKLSGPELYHRLQRTMVAEALLEEAEATLASSMVPDDGTFDGDRAYWYFIGCWMARNGMAGMARTDYQMAVRWTAGGGSPAIRWRSATDSIPAWHARLQNVVILSRDAFEIIPRFEDATHTAIYVDPPYPRSSRSHGNYLHDFEEGGLFVDDHENLARCLHDFSQSRVVLSSYDCPRIRALYRDWTFIDCSRMKNLSQQNGRGTRKSEAPEVLIVNGDPSE